MAVDSYRWAPRASGRAAHRGRVLGPQGALAVVSVVVLVGCGGLSTPKQGVLLVADGDAAPAGTTPTEASGGTTLSSAPGGSAEFSEEILYKLLVAEFAGQRNQLGLALTHYLDVARATQDPTVVERAVRIAVFARDQERGLEAARLWTEVAPDDLDAKQVYAALLIRSGAIEAAVEELAALLSRMSGASEQGFKLVGDMLSREKDQAAALEVMEHLVAGHEDDPDALFAFAQLSARVGELGRAAELLEQVLALNRDDVRAATFRARVLHRQGNTAQAVESLKQTVARRPDDQNLRMTYARLLVDAKRYEEAREQFERLAQDAPGDPDVRFGLGLLLLQTNRLEQARIQFERLVELGERTHTAHFYLGQIAEAMNESQAALEAYEKVDGGEHYLNSQIRVAVLLAEGNEVEAAREHLRSLQRRNLSDAVRIYQAEAEVLARNGELEEAMRVYNEALTKYPKNSDLLYGRAMLAEKLDRLDILERDLRAVIEREPNNADALNALGYTLADRTERYEEALELIKRALELKPDNHYIIDSMGWVLYRMGRHQEALKYLRRAMSLEYDPEIAAHLGEVLWVTGDKQGAREVWETALESTPEDELLLKTIERFNP